MTIRRRIDVNLEELDQIIDRSTQAPLSEAEGQKLKTALHGMAERLSSKRTTEKTKDILLQDTVLDKPQTGESTPAGHGRNSVAAFSGADAGAQSHTPRSIPATLARSAAGEKCTARKSRQRW